ncbi:MAG: signal peptidase I [Solobacterium sp.]|nr:signal peptidase I [Solobacterium sp.]
MKKKKKTLEMPSSNDVEKELERIRYKRRYGSTLRSTVLTLISVAAIAVLISMLLLPVLRIYGSSMTPTVTDGDIVLAIKTGRLKSGDVIGFYFNNKILIKRVIAEPGDWVDIAEDGTIYINNEEMEEPYISEKAYGETNIKLPYQVPEGKVFVMGDHRSVSIDSRNTAVGCVSEEVIVGRILWRIWPFDLFGKID